MEVFWEEPNAIQKKLIKGYQVQVVLKGAIPVKIFSERWNTILVFFLDPPSKEKKSLKTPVGKIPAL